MPSLLRSVRRSLLVMLVAIAFGATAATAQAGVSVTIQPRDGGNPKTIATDDVEPDIGTGSPQRFRIAKPGGGTREVEVSDGVSLQKLLIETDTNFGFDELQMTRGDGSTLTLTRDEIKDPRNQQVFYTDAQGVTRFVGPRQDNGIVLAKDYFEVSGTIVVTQRSESKLKVTISPTRKKIDLGGSITFKATVSGNEPDESVTYTWWLAGRKQTVAGPRFTQEFPSKDDVYKFFVAVRIEGSDVSKTVSANITVGDPDKADEEQAGGGSSDAGSYGSGTVGTGGTGSSTYTDPYTPVPSTPTPAPPSPDTPKPPPVATSGTPVEGNLLADVSDPPPSNILESAAQAARQGKQKDATNDGDVGVSEAAVSIVAALALLGLGAGIETRQGRLPRLRRPHLRLPRRSA